MMRRWIAVSTLVLLVVASTPATASGGYPDYAGWQTNSPVPGIRGYIEKNTVSGFSGSEAVFDWINLCGSPCSGWAQTGVYQGSFAGGTSYSAVHIYYENVDPCGDYYAGDKGAPGTPFSFYGLEYGNGGRQQFSCSGGELFYGYLFNYRKGSSTATPFFHGVLSVSAGDAGAKTEVQNNPPLGTSYFGCSSATSCNSTTYALQLRTSTSTWLPWQQASTSSNDMPPFLHTYNNYWSFKTCATSC